MILWDSWGLAESEHAAEDDLELLDEIASLTASADPSVEELRRLYERDGIRVPQTVLSADPLGGPRREVTLR